MDETKISDTINRIIEEAISDFPEGGYEMAQFERYQNNPFETLLSFGELVDRLSIVNFKLYNLKDKVMVSDDPKFKAWAAEHDVVLVEERARLKRCIDLKLLSIIERANSGSENFNPEVKRYGQ